jgi:hypothetical protein
VFERDVPLLINGETGSGKEAFAKAVHQASQRATSLRRPQLRVDPREPDRERAVRLSRRQFTGARKEGMRGKLQQADGGTCSSTRSATCRWRCKPACCGCWKTAGGADWRRAAGGGRAHHQRHPPRFAGAGGRRQFPRRPVLPPQWPGSALPALRERSDKSQLLDFLLAEEAGGSG